MLLICNAFYRTRNVSSDKAIIFSFENVSQVMGPGKLVLLKLQEIDFEYLQVLLLNLNTYSLCKTCIVT